MILVHLLCSSPSETLQNRESCPVGGCFFYVPVRLEGQKPFSMGLPDPSVTGSATCATVLSSLLPLTSNTGFDIVLVSSVTNTALVLQYSDRK